jgi:hypothetical protein
MADSHTTEAERRKSVKAAIADSRLAGLPPPGPAEQAVLDAFIRGEIEAENLVEAIKKMLGISSHGARDG